MPMLTDKIDKEFLNENKHLKCIANYAVGYFFSIQIRYTKIHMKYVYNYKKL